MWKKLGPWSAQPVAGKIKITATAASHGAANLSGIELWQGSGDIPQLAKAGFAESPRADQIAFFENKIRPVLVEHCYECHSATAKKIKGGLVLDSRAGVHKGGDTGPLLTPGDPAASLLIEAVNHLSEDTAMPPKQKLPANVIADLETWVRMGAPDPRNTEARKATPEKPLLLICGGPLTTAANALLLAPDIASRIIVFNILVTHYGYNGKDGWAAYIVAKQTRYVDWGGRGRGFWDRNSNLPN
ncbi:MAG: hypothetical protein J0L73_01745 [Verrucomicrobia bacterium]|nr:hypothetical protein [Verrucomicrobiota bacterium]